jgi:hypothetical protein
MVVIPTRTNVSLTYEYTRIELAGIVVSVLGLGLVGFSATRSLRDLRQRRTVRAAMKAAGASPKPGTPDTPA